MIMMMMIPSSFLRVFIIASSIAWIQSRVVVVVDEQGEEGFHCEVFDARGGDGERNVSHVERCPLGHTCFVVWKNESSSSSSNQVEINRMGCFPTTESMSRNQCTQDVCINRKRTGGKSPFFCCCTGDRCNSQFRWEPSAQTSSSSVVLPHPPSPATQKHPSVSSSKTSSSSSSSSSSSTSSSTLFLSLYILVPVCVTSVLSLAGVAVYRQRKVAAEFHSLSTGSDETPVSPSTPSLCNREIRLIEIKARGRFGAVWKGSYENRLLAVKIFPLQDKQSWYAEQEIYNLPCMDHDNILQFLGVEKRGENLNQEFWLTTTFHERGSLCDYLKSNTVTWEELCKIAQSMARGLTHLHEEIPNGTKNMGMKPAVAHRDFKSKNVLLKSDMTACIGDFGLALIFEPGKSCGDTHGQVGTRRYMAPEVLEGAINFSLDAFLRIDMYACGLVLWELASRLKCSSITPDEYKLPFEAETNHPTLEEMQDLVVTRKVRPAILPLWRSFLALTSLCDTIEECWDHDAEARLSASCVTERIKAMQNYPSIQTVAHNNSLNESILMTSLTSPSSPFITKEDQ